MKNTKNLTGRKIGRLTAVRPIGVDEKGRYLWLCICDCGNEKNVPVQNLSPKGGTKSCGCIMREHNKNRPIRPSMNVTHGESSYIKGKRTPEYNSWLSMRQRCNDKNHSTYDAYGGRGIKVCEEWEKSYEVFLNDMGRKPFKKTSIDRIDNSKGYFKENCRWSTQLIQTNNTRRNKFATAYGKTDTIANLSRIFGIPYRTMFNWFEKKPIGNDISKYIKDYVGD